MDKKDIILSYLDIIRLSEKNARRIGDSSKELFSLNFKILACIYRLGSPSQTEIVQDIDLAKSNVANFCKGLIGRGLITSRADEKDRRIVYYELTKEGKKYVDSICSEQGGIIDCLPPTKQDKLIKHLQGLQKVFEEIERENRDAKVN